MPVIAQLDVAPIEAQVVILDTTWQDYPRWESGDEWVAYRAPSLVHPDEPPYPGLAVATRSDIGPAGPQTVRVEVWQDEDPEGLHLVHRTTLSVSSSHGVMVGNQFGGRDQTLGLEGGAYPLSVWVDGITPETVSRVVFVLGTCTPKRPQNLI
jgi:hypothetical protein